MSKIPSELKKILAPDGCGKIGFRYLNLKGFNPKVKPTTEIVHTFLFSVPGLFNFAPLHPQYCYTPDTPGGDNFGFFRGDKEENEPVETAGPTPRPAPTPTSIPTPRPTSTPTTENKPVDGIYKDMKSYNYQFVYAGSWTYYNCIMKKVEKELLASSKWGPGSYNPIHKCHEFMLTARSLYNRILKKTIQDHYDFVDYQSYQKNRHSMWHT